MGWNSWDAYGLSINEDQFLENAKVLASKLLPYGWRYAVIDEGWFLRNPLVTESRVPFQYELDGNGRFIPAPERFPSAVTNGANTGFQAIGRSVHAQGLKFGIHIVRGIPRDAVSANLPLEHSVYRAREAADTQDACPWNPDNWGVRDNPAGQAWYDSLLRQYASWGVDYLKVDCISDHPYRPAEIRMIHRAIAKAGRPILLSLSPGPTSPSLLPGLSAYAQMWRVSDDIWDEWIKPQSVGRGIRDQFVQAAAWAPFARPGAWPDLDMLPIGYLGPHPGEGIARETKLNTDEQQSLLTLWAMARSPLILGANLTQMKATTEKLLTNRDVIALNQEAHDAHQVAREGNIVTWIARGSGSTVYLACFNLNDTERRINRTFRFYNLSGTRYRGRDLWSGASVPPTDKVDAVLPPHGVLLLALNPDN
jgi:hypothetical protein